MKRLERWTRLDWLSAAGSQAAVTVATLGVWTLVSEDTEVLAAFVVAWVGALVVGGLLLAETVRRAWGGVAPGRVGQRRTGGGGV